MPELVDRRYALIRRFLRLKKQYGAEQAGRMFTQREHDDMFNYIVLCSTIKNTNPDGSVVIPTHL